MTNIKPYEREYVNYTLGEEILNSASHFVGALFGAAALALCIVGSLMQNDTKMLIGSIVYGASLILLYSVSFVYHFLPKCRAKKIMRIVDHCTIYLLIAGTYTPVILSIMNINPLGGWLLLAFVWGVSAIAIVFTAIDFVRYNVFSMICYIAIGWCIVVDLKDALQALTFSGFMLMLAGGISYTLGAILYGIGSKIKYFHSVFHIFVVIGSILQFLSIILYAI